MGGLQTPGVQGHVEHRAYVAQAQVEGPHPAKELEPVREADHQCQLLHASE